MTVLRKSGKKIQSILFLSTILIFLILFMGCDSTGTSGDGNPDSENNGFEYLGQTTALDLLFFDEYGAEGGVYNTDLYLFSEGTTYGSGTGLYIFLETFFSTSQVAAGTYLWSGNYPNAANTFSDGSGIAVITNGVPTSVDMITAGEFTISINGSNYTISGNLTTVKGSAAFSYSGPATNLSSIE